MLFIVMALWAFLQLLVALGCAVGVGQTSRWLAAHPGSDGERWLVAGTVLEAGFALLLLWMAGRSARTNGASFLDAVTFRGGSNRYEAACIAMPVYSLLIAAAVAAGYSVFLAHAAAPFLVGHRPVVIP